MDFSKAGTQRPLDSFSADCRPFRGITKWTSQMRAHSSHLIPSRLIAGHSGGKPNGLLEGRCSGGNLAKPSWLIAGHSGGKPNGLLEGGRSGSNPANLLFSVSEWQCGAIGFCERMVMRCNWIAMARQSLSSEPKRTMVNLRRETLRRG